jgi:hypothetical protein
MPARLTQEYVDAWLAEHRPDFKPVDGWFYTNNCTPIPGTCLTCGEKCAPRLHDMRTHNGGHCNACGVLATNEKTAARRRARGEDEIRRVAAERGYEVVKFFTRRKKNSYDIRGFQEITCATLRCGCGNVWDTRQPSLCSAGNGCGNCAEFGYDSSKPGAIYLIGRNLNGIEQRGYGISNAWKRRTKGYKRFGWRLLDVMEFSDGETARNTESMLNRVVGVTAGRSVEPDSVYYKNKEAWSDGSGIPMFNSVWAFLCWAAPLDARELQDA